MCVYVCKESIHTGVFVVLIQVCVCKENIHVDVQIEGGKEL